MGQKVSPTGLRIGINKDWQSKWYAPSKDYKKYLINDLKIRKYLKKYFKEAGISKVEIERNSKRTEVIIHTARPGMVIGRGGEEIEKIKKALTSKIKENVQISIVDIKKPDLVAKLVADNIARQIQNRASFRVVQKQAIRRTMKAGAKGIKTLVSGRLNGIDIARSEGYTEGTIPLHTLRADIDYGTSEADTTFGKIGVKVWIYKGEILPEKRVKEGNKDVDAKKDQTS
ncbi:MAG: 30S ribosomal protein S3 [Bacilli bacterium]|jgi:small subunit ribosomal protein S3|nr:30S ribosomal protein S3 [Bacilli bacterium]